ncbi:PLD nuclease N-terminal domain-containing protein [Streptomyces sp. NPDC050161]|uniref:PLD nuclease N-terminal domain-containing protein n=1 Tax=Streptomyces sp. NPDC050161 TaxID=3365604 RepID=UPI00379EE2F5
MHAPLVQQITVAAAASDPGALRLGAALLVLVLLCYVAFVIGALVGIVRSRLTGGMKAAWVVFTCVAPFLGSLVWFLVGRRDAARRPAVG